MNLAASRETKRFFDRAHRRAMNTGLPISRAIEIETERAAMRPDRRKMSFSLSRVIGSHKTNADTSTLPEKLYTHDPEHEAVLPISEAPSPIPEQNPVLGGVDVEKLTDTEFGDAAKEALGDTDTDVQINPTGKKTVTAAADQTVSYHENVAFGASGLNEAETDPTKAEDEAAFAEDVAQEVAAKQKNIGRPVSWTQMGKEYRGTIAHVIPPNVAPRDMGVEAGATLSKKQIANGDKPKTRDHISYVVTNDETGALAWPMRSSLTVLDAE